MTISWEDTNRVPRVTPFRDLDISDDLAQDLARCGVHGTDQLGRLAALIMESPVGPSVDTVAAGGWNLLRRLCRELYWSFKTSDHPRVSVTSEHRNDRVTYTLRIIDPSFVVSAKAWSNPGALHEDMVTRLSGSWWASQLDGLGEARAADPVDPLRSLWGLVLGLQQASSGDAEWSRGISHSAFDIVVSRFALTGNGRRTLDQLGQIHRFTREGVRQIESRAINRLRTTAPTARLARLRQLIESICDRLDCAPTDPILARYLEENYPGITTPLLPWLKLLATIQEHRWRDRIGRQVIDVNDAVIDVLSRRSPIQFDDLVAAVSARLGIPATDGIAVRIRYCRACELDAEFVARLSETPDLGSAGVRGRRLNAMVRILDSEGPMHYSLVQRKLLAMFGPSLALDARNVHAWLDRNKDVFAWAGPGTFRLRKAGEAVEGDQLPAEYAPTRRRGVGDDIVRLLLEHQPRTIAEIEEAILQSYVVNRGSIAASITQDSARRFQLLPEGLVFLRDADVDAFNDERPKGPGVDWTALARDLKDSLNVPDEEAS